MNEMMNMQGMHCNMSGIMMGGMSLIGVLLIITLVLGIAALLKYLFCGGNRQKS